MIYLNRRGRSSAGLTALEAVVAIFIISILFSLAVARFQRVVLQAQRTALRAELANIRRSIELFKALNGRNPADLRELAQKQFVMPAHRSPGSFPAAAIKGAYLSATAVDAEGNILDPFGNPFSYDPGRGEVRTATKGLETW